ncbi:MAG: PAS domain S-box protein [Ignavibacteria bacterium]|nr:PAS domain S-box protein [Ignavibacteria bacterium]
MEINLNDKILISEDNTNHKFQTFHIPCNFFDILPDMSFVLDSSCNILHCNKTASEFFSTEKRNFVGKNFLTLISEEKTEEFKQNFEKAITEGINQQFESVFVAGEQQKIVQVILSPFFKATKFDPTNYSDRLCFVFARDISVQKEKELDLVRFANVAEYTVNPLEITDVEGKIIYVNPAFERSSGYTREELIGKNPNIFSSHKHSKDFWKNMWETIKQGKVWIGEVVNRKKDGQLFYTDLLISPIIDNNGKLIGYFGIHRDKTEQKKLEQQLIHAQKMESIGLLAAGLAHEVGNPLASISSLVQVIQRMNKDEFTNQKLELIKSQINRISKIIRDLVNFSRQSTYELQSTEINKVLKSAIEIARVSKKAKGINFVEEYDPEIPILYLVPDQLQQVFLNILINAIDALCVDADRLIYFDSKPQIVCKTYKDTNKVYISISDNGIGIPESAIDKIFDPFYTTKKVGEGTGLGLWVSYNIIKSFQGEIQVNSSEGEGATFTIILPINLDATE